MFRIIIQFKSHRLLVDMLPFMTCLRELSLFMLLCTQGFVLATSLDYFDEMGLTAFSCGINNFNYYYINQQWVLNKLTGPH